MSADLELRGSGYAGREHALRVRAEDDCVAIAIHRPAAAERAAALIFLTPAAADELERFLREER